MEVFYKRDMKHNYMIVQPKEWEEYRYESRMMLSNTIEGLLKFHLKQVDQQVYFYYEITSKQPLNRLLEVHHLKAEDLKKLIFSMAATLDRMENYLLKDEQILLEPEYVYIDPDSMQVSLCLIPGRQESFSESLVKLLQFILGKVNHQDHEMVIMAYGLYQESQKENYSMGDLLKYLTGSEKQNKKTSPSFKEDSQIFEAPKGEKEERKEGIIREKTREKIEEKNRKNGEKSAGIIGKIRGKDREKDKRKGRKTASKRSKKIYLPVFVLIPAALFFLYMSLGIAGIKQYGWLVFAAGAMLLLWNDREEKGEKPEKIETLSGKAGKQTQENPAKQSQEADIWKSLWKEELQREELCREESWEVKYAEEEKTFGAVSQACSKQNLPESSGDTVLLVDLDEKKRNSRLVFLDRQTEDMEIAYFPFIVGKQEHVADGVIKKETVSRIHLKIDQTENGYQLTDLNSTNGTTVNGRTLETNETVELHSGDEIYAADVGFTFVAGGHQ